MSQEKKLAAAVVANLIADIKQLESSMERGHVPKQRVQTATELHARDAIFCLFSKTNDALNHWLQLLDMNAIALQEKVKAMFPLSTKLVLAELKLL